MLLLVLLSVLPLVPLLIRSVGNTGKRVPTRIVRDMIANVTIVTKSMTMETVALIRTMVVMTALIFRVGRGAVPLLVPLTISL